jgi:spore maturation protein CgeB
LQYDLESHYLHADEATLAARQFNETFRPQLEDELLRQVQAAHQQKPVDIFFSYFYGSFVRPEIIQEIRRMGIITLNWYCNASYQFHLVEKIAPAYDYCLVPEKFRLQDYRRIGANPVYCQEAANPNIYRPYNLSKEYDVVFVGAQYGNRAQYIRYLIDKGIDARVWGPGWLTLSPPVPWEQKVFWWARRVKQHIMRRKTELLPVLPLNVCGNPLSDDEMIKMYSRSKISLGFSNVGNTHLSETPIKQVRLRDFEAPMSGAFYMVEYMPELEEFFEPDKEIVFYADKYDLADKVEYYLVHEEEREKIRKAGHQRAVQEHSWQRRFQQVFKQIGIN